MSTGDTQSLIRQTISTEGDTNSAITGFNVLAESSNTMKCLQVDSSGYLKVSIEVDSVGIGGGTSYTEDVATANPIVGTATMMERDDIIATLTPAAADWASMRCSAEGALWTQDFNSDAILSDLTAIKTAVEILDNAISGSEMQVDIVSGSSSNTEYSEDAVTPNPIVGIAGLMERDDVISSLTPVAGDFAAFRCSAEGALWTQDFNSDAILADTAALVVDAAAMEALLITIDSDTNTIQSDTTAILADTAAMDTNLATLAGAVSGSEMQVDLVSAAVTNAGTFAVQVDGSALTALQLIDNIVAVDDAAFTLGSGSGVMVMGFAGTQSVNANDSAALACDTDGALHISDGGNSITIDGTVTANLSATDNAVLDSIQTAVELIDNAISGSEMQVDLVSANVTNAGTFAVQSTLQAGSAAIGKLAANSGVDIGDVDITSIVNDSINGPESSTGPSVDSYTQVAINLTTGANQVLASSAANKQIWVYGYTFTCGDAAGQTVSFQDEDDAALSGIMEFAQYGGAAVSPSGNFAMPIWKLATDKDLEVDITGGDVDGWISIAVVDVS